MTSTILPPAALEPAAVASWRFAARIVVINVLIWSGICVVGALTSYSDRLAQGEQRAYLTLLWNWWCSHLPMMLLSSGLYLWFTWRPALTARIRTLALLYLALLLVFLPLELCCLALIDLLKTARGVDFQQWRASFLLLRKFDWFLEFAWMSGTCIAVLALCSWRQNRTRELAWRQAQTDNLELRLALEEQRLLALRSQLEPHFIFNALNAISSLVRSDDKRVALSGIQRLSELLRYALTASARDWVSFAEELDFVRDYLALQQLRYGERLRVNIEGTDDAVCGGDCPPLLLQPLIENALRHDLDCHTGASDILLRFQRDGAALLIMISNPVPALAGANPGLGLGLRHTRERLRLAYGDSAQLDTTRSGGRFQLRIRLPLHAAQVAP